MSDGKFVDINAGRGGVGFRITSVWVAIAVHDDHDEGLAAMMTPNGWLPLLAADETRLGQIRTLARELATASGKAIRIVRFDVRTDVEILEP